MSDIFVKKCCKAAPLIRETFQFLLKSENVTDTLHEDYQLFRKHLQWDLNINRLSLGNVKIVQNDIFYEAYTPAQYSVYSLLKSLTFINIKFQQDETPVSWFYCKPTLHVSGTFRTHHQEYNKM
jgi:hypothetical protein